MEILPKLRGGSFHSIVFSIQSNIGVQNKAKFPEGSGGGGGGGGGGGAVGKLPT